MDELTEIIIQDDYQTMLTRVYWRVNKGGHIVFIGYDGEYLVEQDHKPGEAMTLKPLFIVPLFGKEQFLRIFMSAASRTGIATEREDHLKGRLEASARHLEDMREAFKSLLNDKLSKP